MDNFIKKLFQPEVKKPSVIKQTNKSDKVINEAIILDIVGSENLDRFYECIGAYGARDGLLEDCSTIPCENNAESHAEIAAIINLARENNDPNYRCFMLACEAKDAYFKKMADSFGSKAKEKVGEQKQVLLGNSRVQDAITQVAPSQEGCCKEVCSK